MSRRFRRSELRHVATMTTAFAMSLVTTLAWAWTGGVDQLGLPVGPGDPTITGVVPGVPPRVGSPAAVPGQPAQPAPQGPPAPGEVRPGGVTDPVPVPLRTGTGTGTGGRGAVVPAAAPAPAPAPAHAPGRAPCRTGALLVPTCGVLWGVAPAAYTDVRGPRALAAFERDTGRHQDIYHAYHRGTDRVFPTPDEIAIAREPGRERILLLNWKPTAKWAAIARGDRRTDAFLDRLARHINQEFPEPFFLAVHHEGENEVRDRRGSGWTADDYRAMYRYVVKRLRARGVDNIVTVLVHMAYVPHSRTVEKMYPGDDVVDWIGFDSYSHSDPGYGHGDFAELLNRRSSVRPDWPGIYAWATRKHPRKPMMVAEWGVWYSRRNPGHQPDFYTEVQRQIARFPRIKALVYFDTPRDPEGRASSVDATRAALAAYRRLGRSPVFQVEVPARRR